MFGNDGIMTATHLALKIDDPSEPCSGLLETAYLHITKKKHKIKFGV